MKTRLLFAFIAIAMASCSSDDNSSDKDPSENNQEIKLREIIQTEFNQDGSVKLTTKTRFDDKDKALLEEQYNTAGELTAKREFTYNPLGQVESMAFYSADTGLETLNSGYTAVYDANGRVTTINENFIVNGSQATSVTTYLYNPNNTVIMTRNFSSGESAMTTYYLNSTGQVFKKTDSDGMTEQVIYLGANMLNYSNGTITSSFGYDNEHSPKGQQHNTVVNQFNGNVANAMMIDGFKSIDLGRDKYVIQRTDSNGDSYDYQYQFNDDGYPIKLRCFKNGGSIPFFIREIYY
jgi:hypothetical protein